MTGVTGNFESAADFVERLRLLRQSRRERRLEFRDHVVREPLSGSERDEVFAKTGGRCHICGDPIKGKWQADHLTTGIIT